MQRTASVAEDLKQPPYLCPIRTKELAGAVEEGSDKVIHEAQYLSGALEAMARLCTKWKYMGAWAGYEACLKTVLLQGDFTYGNFTTEHHPGEATGTCLEKSPGTLTFARSQVRESVLKSGSQRSWAEFPLGSFVSSSFSVDLLLHIHTICYLKAPNYSLSSPSDSPGFSRGISVLCSACVALTSSSVICPLPR